jgi:hypothetical protein
MKCVCNEGKILKCEKDGYKLMAQIYNKIANKEATESNIDNG